MAVFHGTVNW